MKTAFIFPGQGAQLISMGSDIAQLCPAADELFNRANAIVGYDLKKLCFQGPEDKLNSTTVSQPAIFVTSAAMLQALRDTCSDRYPKPDFTAGLSLGEYTALYAADLISFEDALTLVQKRGIAMQAAADATDGSMVSIIGLEPEEVNRLCKEASHAELLLGVNFNCPGQIVISGTSAACKRAVELAEKYGAVKAVPLKVAGAFHTELMAPAAEDLRLALDDTNIKQPSDIKVIANVTAEYYDSPAGIRQGLVNQLVKPILWEKCIHRLLADGVELFYEIGPGRVLTGLMKRINRKIKVINISSADAIAEIQQPV